MTQMSPVVDRLAVVDWRERNFDLYREIRRLHPIDPEDAFVFFRRTRDDLFKLHPASPLDDDQRHDFEALQYFDYRHDLNLEAELITVADSPTISIELGKDGLLQLIHLADARFSFDGALHNLPVYWLQGYAGGIFVPFQDRTNGESTYGGGRYLFDTRKGANPGIDTDSIRLDFNLAYNPSCAYNERWVCPLASPESKLPFAIAAGEKKPT